MKHILLYGPPGSGKSKRLRELLEAEGGTTTVIGCSSLLSMNVMDVMSICKSVDVLGVEAANSVDAIHKVGFHFMMNNKKIIATTLVDEDVLMGHEAQFLLSDLYDFEKCDWHGPGD